MKRRIYLRALIWMAPAVVLAGYYGYRWVRESVLRNAVAEAIAVGFGGECSIGRAIVREKRVFFGDLRLSHPSGLTITCENAVLPLSGWPLEARGTGRVDALNARLKLGDLPEIAIDKVNVLRKRDEERNATVTTVMIASDCSGLNAALEKRAGVRFHRGRFEIYSRPDTGAGKLNFPVLVRLLDFKVRGTDGKFEVEAVEARATVRVTGTRGNPVIDLGELEPWLSNDFVRGFEDLVP